jgi:hypothetical protein
VLQVHRDFADSKATRVRQGRQARRESPALQDPPVPREWQELPEWQELLELLERQELLELPVWPERLGLQVHRA